MGLGEGLDIIKNNDTCAWTPNKVFIHFVLVFVETARVLLQSWWARLSTGASREAPVDNECLGKSATPQTKMNSTATAQPPSNRKTAEVASMVNMADIVV